MASYALVGIGIPLAFALRVMLENRAEAAGRKVRGLLDLAFLGVCYALIFYAFAERN